MRKSVALSALAMTALLVGTAGCSTDPNSGSGDGNTLTISGWSGDEVMAALIDQFKKDNPDVTVKLTELPWPSILTQINTELVSNTASDVVAVFPGNGNPITAHTLAKGDFLDDLSDSPWVDSFSEANRKVMGVGDEIFMVANNFTIIPATYNTQALEEIGASAPSTWSEVIDLCTAAQEHGKVAYAMAGLAGGPFHYLGYALSATLIDGTNPDFAEQHNAGETTFSDSPWTEVFDKYAEMRDAGCFTKDATGTSFEVARSQVAKGEAVGIVTVSNHIADIERESPEGTTFETAALPATDSPEDTILPVGLGAGYGVNAKAKNKELAHKFIDFYMSEEGLKTALSAGSIFPSIDVDGFEPTPTLAGVAEQVRSDKTAAFPDQTWPSANMTKVYEDEAQKLLGNQTTPTEALKAMDAAFTE